MNSSQLLNAIRSGRILVSDGAWGTFLQRKGLKPGECPELWNVSRRGDVLDIARSYVEAGADMIETNSFGGNAFKLAHYGLENRVDELNEAAAAISREAVGNDRFVLGSMGPTGVMLIMGDVSEQQLYDAFARQAVALEKGGADAACIETMFAPDEAVCAIRAVRENTSLDVICTFTFEKTVQNSYRTMMGISPSGMALALADAGADVIGTNCGNGIENMIPIVSEIKAACPAIPVLVHANAGMPVHTNGMDVYPDSPEFMASLVPDIIRAGASIIGGCCGTTPEHIREIVREIGKYGTGR